MTVRMSRREREQERHRREILAVATDVFSEKGFNQATMAEIAERAEFAVGTLYRFFEDKESLYEAIILDAARELEQALSEALDGEGTEVERLERCVEAKTRLILRHIPTARLYFTHMIQRRLCPTLTLDAKTREIHDRVLVKIESVFRSGVRKKLFANMDPWALTLGFEAISSCFLPDMLERPGTYSAEQMVAMIRALLFDGIRLRPEK